MDKLEIESLVNRIEAIRDFDEELLPHIRAFEARQRRIDRTKQYTYSMSGWQVEQLFELQSKLIGEQTLFRRWAQGEWMGKHPYLEPPSFSPGAIRKRFSSRSPNNIFNKFKLWVNNPEHPRPDLTDPLLIQLADEIDDVLWEFDKRRGFSVVWNDKLQELKKLQKEDKRREREEDERRLI